MTCLTIAICLMQERLDSKLCKNHLHCYLLLMCSLDIDIKHSIIETKIATAVLCYVMLDSSNGMKSMFKKIHGPLGATRPSEPGTTRLVGPGNCVSARKRVRPSSRVGAGALTSYFFLHKLVSAFFLM